MDLTPFKECGAHKNAVFIGNDDAPFRPCCWFEGNIDATSFNEYQEKLSQLDIEKTCRYCIEMEEQGGNWSHRMDFNAKDPNEIVASISFDNLCNLKCITCSPINSSQLAIELKNPVEKKRFTSIHKKEPVKTEFLKKMLTDATISSLRIEILGGEPLINPAVYNFLDWLVEQPYASVTSVNITTNGTTYDDRFTKYITYLRGFTIQLSVDGVEDTFEYIRYGAKFNTLNEVADKFYGLRELYPDKFNLSFNYTLSWMNSLHIAEFFKWIHDKYPKVPHIFVTKLEWPYQYPINILPIEVRKQIVEQVSSKIINLSDGVQVGFTYYKQHMLNTPEFDSVKSTKWNIKTGINSLARNDKLINRNSDFNKTFNPVLELLKKNHIT